MDSAEIISLFAYLIYLEIIELRFCGFDKNIKKNLILKAKKENRNNFMNDNDDESVDEDDDNDISKINKNRESIEMN